jgi:hypothetical protein
MDRWLHEEKAKTMIEVIKEKIVEGRYMAEVEIRCEDDGTPFSPVVMREDEFKTDRVRTALKRGDIAAAKREARVFEIREVA